MKEKSLGDFALLRGMRQDLKRMTVLEGEADQVLSLWANMLLMFRMFEAIHSTREKKEHQSLADPELPKVAKQSV